MGNLAQDATPEFARHVLLVEDSATTRMFIRRGLETEGYAVHEVAELEEARAAWSEQMFDAVILDRVLADADALELISWARTRGDHTPVLILSALNEPSERVAGLKTGADDYLDKPFSWAELQLRLDRMISRQSRLNMLAAGDTELDITQRVVYVAGEGKALTDREFRLLRTLLLNRGRVVSRARLLEEVWGLDEDPGTNTLPVYINYLRKKVGNSRIKNVRGKGYTFLPIGASPARFLRD